MRLVLYFLLFLVTAPAWAEWVKVSEVVSSTAYIDPATIQVNGNMRRVWELQELKERDKNGEISRRALTEYDCKEGRVRLLSFSFHSGPMATGDTLVSNYDPIQWIYIAPASSFETRFKLVCAVK